MDAGPRAKAAVTGAADCHLCVVPLQAAAAAGAAFGEPSRAPIPPTNEGSGSGGIAAVRVRPDGKIAASGGWDRRVRLWQWGKWKPLAVLQQHTGTVNAGIIVARPLPRNMKITSTTTRPVMNRVR